MEVLSQKQWDTIAPLLPELMSLAPIVSCLKAFFGSDAQVPVVQIYRTDPLVCQRADLDDVVGKRREVVTGVAQIDRQGRTFIDGRVATRRPGYEMGGKRPSHSSRRLPLFGRLSGSDLDPAFDC